MSRLLLAAVAALFSAAAAAQMYRWVDKDGKVHYTDTPPPATMGRNVQQRSAAPSVVESSQQPYAVQQAVKNFPVVLYTHADCKEPCADGRKLLTGRGVPFREVAVTDEKTQAELKKASGDTQVPVLLVGSQASRGYETEMWHAALDAAGYPKSAPPGARAAKPSAPAPAPTAPAEAADAAKADKPQQAAAEPAPSGRYAPLPPDPKVPSPPATGPYAPR